MSKFSFQPSASFSVPGKIAVAVLGLGRMGTMHVQAARESRYVSEVYGYEPDAERLRTRSKELGVTPAFSLEHIWADAEIQLVYIATPNETHVPLAIAALKAGKAVMCEKPMGQNLAEARELLKVAKETGGFLQIGFELHYSRLYQQVKAWIDKGLIGKVVNLQCRYYCSEFHKKNSWRSEGTGSFLIGEKLSHYLDLQRWWFGASPESVYSVASPKVVPYFQHEDNHQMILRFPNGGVGTLNFIMYIAESLQRDPLVDLLEQQVDDGHLLQHHICGSKGAIETDVFRRRIRRWEFTDGPQGLKSRIAETVTYPPDEDAEWIHNTHGQNMRVAELVAKGLPPEVSASDAYETMKLCFAAERSEAEQRILRLEEMETLPTEPENTPPSGVLPSPTGTATKRGNGLANLFAAIPSP